jgi:serine/threonine protein kinase
MPISINDFWRLAIASGLLSTARAKQLHGEFSRMKGAAQQGNVATLTQWLVANGALTRYQASLLAAGRPGPFVFGDYVISERIDGGRLARLFRATRGGTQPVLLVFTAQLPALNEWPDYVAEQSQEATRIESPHVVRVLTFVAESSHTFTVVEDLRGQSLREQLAGDKEKLTWEQAARIGFQAALGLVATHEKKSGHGKLCPENLWIDPNGTVKLMQFPLAPAASPAERLELPMADYLAPELRDPEQSASGVADIYALGCILFELIAGRVPFPGGAVKQRLERHAAEIPQRLDRLVPGVPEELADLVAEMIDKEPLLRCRTASQVAHLLAPFATDVAENARRRPGPPKAGPGALTPGYGAWSAPAWQPPPRQSPRSPQPSPPTTAEQPATEPAAKPSSPARPGPAAEKRPASKGKRIEQPPEPGWAAAAEIEFPEASTLAIGEDSSSPDEPWQVPLVPRRTHDAAQGTSGARRWSKSLLIMASVGLASLVAIIVTALLVFRGDGAGDTPPAAISEVKPVAATPSSTPESLAPQSPANAKTSEQMIEPDDGTALWIAPAAGEPLSLNYLPSGSQVFLVLRPADLLASAEGAKLLDALGPAGERARAELLATLGVELTNLEQLSIAFYPDDAGTMQTTFAMELRQGVSQAKLLEAWRQPKPAEHKSTKYFQGERFAYYLPAGADGREIAIAPAAAMQDIIERNGPPLLRKGLERLLRSSDASRHVNLLFAPSYLLTDGHDLLVGDLEKLHDPLAAFLDESIQGVLASAHLGDLFFLEFRATGSVDKSPADLVRLLQSRWEKVPERVENYVASLQPAPYGRLIVNRFPRMMQLLADYTRGGVEEQQAVLRAYLPAIAAHNLLLGAELTLFEEPQAGAVAASRAAPKDSASAVAALAKPITLSFPRDTLERCLELLAKEIDVEIVIQGADLQAEGITRNQSFGLDERQQPAGEILQRVLQLANPAGKLVYVIRPQADGREAIFITTRSAATKRGDRLPAELAPKSAVPSP